MMVRHFRRVVAALAMASLLCGSQAAAGQITTTDSVYSFTGGDNLYGPWTIQTFQYQWQCGEDIPSITLLNRNDNDRPTATSSRAVYVDDYHTFSPHFYTYAQASFANGNIQPFRSAYVEADARIGWIPNLVLAAGGAELQNPGGTSTSYISVGPAFYVGPMVVALRFLPSDTNGVRTSATQLNLQYTSRRNNQVVLGLIDGTQPSVLVGLPPSAAVFQRLFQANLTVKHWFNNEIGIVLGGTIGNFSSDTAANSFHQRGITFGILARPR
jgi:YaiO family outer membrane protein